MIDLSDPLVAESLRPVLAAATNLLDAIAAYQASEIETTDRGEVARLSLAFQVVKATAREMYAMQALQMGDSIAHLAASHICAYRQPVRTNAMAHMQAVIEHYVENPSRGGAL